MIRSWRKRCAADCAGNGSSRLGPGAGGVEVGVLRWLHLALLGVSLKVLLPLKERSLQSQLRMVLKGQVRFGHCRCPPGKDAQVMSAR